MNNNIALFDLDNTLLPMDSDHGWSQFLIDIGVLDREEFEQKNDRFYAQYKAGTLDILEFLDFQFTPLKSHARAQLDEWHLRYMNEVIEPNIRPSALQLVQEHQTKGHLCAMVTATNSFITRPIATRFGISHLVATEPAQHNGEFTGAVLGTPCFREGKIARVNQWLVQLGHRLEDFNESWFYSDSINDLPLLEVVKQPVATNPDDRLRQIAQDRGWPILELYR